MIDPHHPLPDWLEDAWMQRYLNRELTGPEEAAFEAYCLDRAHLLARIEADTALRDVLAANSDLVPAGNRLADARPARHPRFAALAASLLIGVLGGGMAWQLITPAASVEGELTRVFFDTERGETGTARVDHAQSNSQFVLIDVVVPSGATNVQARIGSADWTPVSVANDGVSSILVSRAVLRGQREVTLAYQQGDQVVERALPLPPLRFD
jgi:hypothetical protein